MKSRRGFISGAATGASALALTACATYDPVPEAPVSFNVLYPNHEGARFDLAYYRAAHIPMVMRVMGAHSFKLVEGVPMGATPPPFVMVAQFHFPSDEALDAALAKPEMADLRNDLPNFSDIRPTILRGRAA